MRITHQFNLIRSIFPSWRFFEEVTEVPILHYRIQEQVHGETVEFGPWKLASKKLRSNWRTLLFNPEGNRAMACNSLLEFIQAEIETEAGDIKNSVSYRLIAAMVRSRILDEYGAHRFAEMKQSYFQFRIGLVFQGSTPDEAREILLSNSEIL